MPLNISLNLENEYVALTATQLEYGGNAINLSCMFGLVQRTFLTWFPAQSVGSSNVIALDLPYLLVLITGTSQSRQHESRKSPTKSLFDVGSRRISIVTVNTKEYHSDVLAIITRIMRRT
ncbi:hypothetical protein Tco_1288419 [Tanacetum coccineum]